MTTMRNDASEPQIDDHLKARSRQLRHDMTHPERVLWSLLRNRRLGGLKFRRQVVIDRYVVDFICKERKLIVEVDGESHVGRATEDARRTGDLEGKGLQVLRVTNDDVLNDLEAVGMAILRAAGEPV